VKKPSRNILIAEGEPLKMRLISEPCPPLKRIQGYILRMILAPASDCLLPCVHGCVRGRSTVTNAIPHVGARFKIHMDLKDFFPTITVERVYGLYRKIFRYDGRLSWLLANLTTRKGHLPQGAPTSPMTANLLATSMDRHLVGLIKAMRGYYTRYVDDLTFSFRKGMSPANVTRFISTVSDIVRKHGFVVNEEKTSVVGCGRRMVVTGVVVNSKPSAPLWIRKNVRAAIHQRSLELPSADPVPVIQGKLAYVRMICPSQRETLTKGIRIR
jgi:hypothetical protein